MTEEAENPHAELPQEPPKPEEAEKQSPLQAAQVVGDFLNHCLSDEKWHRKRRDVLEARAERAESARCSVRVSERCMTGKQVDQMLVSDFVLGGGSVPSRDQGIFYLDDVEQLTRDFGLEEEEAERVLDAARQLPEWLPSRARLADKPSREAWREGRERIGDPEHAFIQSLGMLARTGGMEELRKEEMTARKAKSRREDRLKPVSSKEIGHVLKYCGCPDQDFAEKVIQTYRLDTEDAQALMRGLTPDTFRQQFQSYLADWKKRSEAQQAIGGAFRGKAPPSPEVEGNATPAARKISGREE